MPNSKISFFRAFDLFLLQYEDTVVISFRPGHQKRTLSTLDLSQKSPPQESQSCFEESPHKCMEIDQKLQSTDVDECIAVKSLSCVTFMVNFQI